MSSPPSIDVEAYRGSVVDAGGTGARFVTRATFSGVIACADARREQLAGLLPGPLRLASSEGSDAHPVLAVFGTHSRGASRYAGIDLEWGVTYDELILLVPFVGVRRTGQLGNFALAMVSSYELPNWVGRVAYGYPKRLARLDRHGPTHTFSTPREGLVFQASVFPDGPWREVEDPPDPELAPIERLRRAAALPWIGCTEGGRFVRSWSRWTWSGARARPVDCRMGVQPALVAGLGESTWIGAPDRSFEVEGMTWWLSWPHTAVVR